VGTVVPLSWQRPGMAILEAQCFIFITQHALWRQPSRPPGLRIYLLTQELSSEHKAEGIGSPGARPLSRDPLGQRPARDGAGGGRLCLVQELFWNSGLSSGMAWEPPPQGTGLQAVWPIASESRCLEDAG
jgi:hypothetical protein